MRHFFSAAATILAASLLFILAAQAGHRWSGQPRRGLADAGQSFVTARDTINGYGIADRAIIARIDRVAAQIPAPALAGHRSGPGVRYLAHAFQAGDDAAISYGLFHEPAAALAFGCALDADLAGECGITPVEPAQAAYEELPGVRCEPMGIALGAPAYEPDRCESGAVALP